MIKPYKSNSVAYHLNKNDFETKREAKLQQTAQKTNSSRQSSISDILKEYLANSTLQGLRYVGDEGISVLERGFWSAVFVLALICSIYFISSIYSKYNINPVIVSLNPIPTSVIDVPFPAITICSMNVAKKNVAERIMINGSDLERDFLSNICKFGQTNAAPSANTSNRDQVHSFMSEVAPSCDEMLHLCRWRSKDVACSSIFQPIITEQGFCCNFNQVPLSYMYKNTDVTIKHNWSYGSSEIDDWNLERGYSSKASLDVYPFRSLGPGAHFGLTVILDAKLDEYFCSPTGSAGFKVLLNSPMDVVHLSKRTFSLPSGCEVHIVFKPVLNGATESLKSMDVDKRHCYYTNEKRLKYFRTYTKTNCKMECLANVTLSKCGCVPFYLPKSKSAEVCGKAQETCSNAMREAIDFWELNELKACKCKAACFELDFEKSISYGRLTEVFRIRRSILKNVTQQYFSKNMVVAKFHFLNAQFIKYTKSEIYGFSEFLSNTGGILGLFLGFSALSVVEILYYFLVKVVWNRMKRNN